MSTIYETTKETLVRNHIENWVACRTEEHNNDTCDCADNGICAGALYGEVYQTDLEIFHQFQQTTPFDDLTEEECESLFAQG